MNDELRYLAARAAAGRLNRRAFLGRAAALGATSVAANTLLSGAARAAGPKNGGTLTMGLGGGQSTDSLDPALAASQVPYMYLQTAGDRLTDVAPDGSIMMKLAEEVSSSKDAKTWTFKIRKGVTFQNGKPLTADDVKQTMERHSDKNSKSGALGIMKGIASMKVDGDNFVVELHTANADLPYLMSDYHLVIQPGGGMDDPMAGIFAGPYKIKHFQPGVRIVFEKYPEYWDKDVGHYDTIQMLVINDSTARNAALQSGQVQMVNSVEPRVADLLKRAPHMEVAVTSGRGFYCFNMFCNTKPFANNDLRMALKLGIDREELVKKILAGYGSVGNDMPVNKAYPLFDDTIPQRTYDPDKARHHLKKSGYDGKIVLLTADGAFSGAVDAAQLYQQSAAKAGIKITVQRAPNDGYWTEVWNKKPFAASYWGGRPTQDQMYSTAYISSAAWNDTRFKDPKFDKIIVEARGELDKAKRKEMYREAGMIIRDHGGLINPMFNQFLNAFDNTKVAGWEANPNGDMMNGLAGVLCYQA